MSEVFHIYDTEELNNLTPSSLNSNWNPSNYLTIVHASDSNVGKYETQILSFENKLCALYYFRNFLDNIKDECPGKDFFNKISKVDNSINSIFTNKTDENINLQIVDFEFDYISLNTHYSGYWIDVSKLILKEIFDEIDSFFDYQYDNEIGDDYFITLNSNGLTTSLRGLQADCQKLYEYKDLNDQFFTNKFYELCQLMNQFWDELSE